MRRAFGRPVVVFHAFLAGLALLVAQQTPQGDPQGGEAPPQQEQPAAPAAIAESGLLPIFGATLELDKSWVDGKKFPSEQPVQDALEQLYSVQLAPCGFNVLRVPFDVTASGSEQSTKLSNLLLWAQTKGLKVSPILTSGDLGKPFSKDYANKAKSFVSAVLTNMKKDEGAYLAAYAQIGVYQLGYPLNSPAYHGTVDPVEAAEALKAAAINVRTAETEGLGESGLSPTQLMVPASFDFELIKNGAIAGTELQPEAYGLAFESLKSYLGLLADSSEIGTFNVEWSPGSITSEATEKLSELVRGMMTDVQGKLIVLSTGYSTGFKSHEDQSRFYAMGFANLADVRASEGVDCPFLGVFWNMATDASGANVAPPSDKTAENISQWDLNAKAAELVQMWQTGSGDADLKWWWNKTRSSFGILSSEGGFTPKQAHQVLTELQGATAQAAVETGVAEAAQKFEEAQAQAVQGQADPTAPPVDPNTGLPIDPNTGLPIDPNNPPIDPNTGLPIDPNAGGGTPGALNIADELKNTLNGALSQLISGVIEKGKQGLTNIIGRLLGDPTLTTPGFDPNAGLPPIDPNSGLPIDPNTGLPIDPNTGLPIDPNTGLPVDPGAGGGAGGVPPAGGTSGQADLAIEGGVSPLGGLTTNVPINVNVNMKNNGDTAAAGATAYLVDGEGNAFAASEQTTLEPGATVNAVISFTPPSAGSVSGAKILLFCDNETNTADNAADLGSLTITDPPGGVEEGVQPEPGSEEPPGGGGTGGGPGGVRPGGLRPGIKIPGLLKLRPLPLKVIPGFKPRIGVSLRPPGFVPKLSLIKPGMFNIGTVLPGTSARLVQKVGSLMAGDGPEATKSIGYPVGQVVPLTIPMTNPFKRPFRSVRATLSINGSTLATRNMGSVMPKQTKTVSFNEFKPTSAGVYNVDVRFEALGLRNRTQLARASCQINVLDGKESSAVVRPGVIPSAGGTGDASGRPKIRIPRPAFGMVPTVVRTSIMRPIFLPAGPTRPSATPTRAFTLPVIGTFTPPARAAVSISQNDIGVNPFPPAENASVSVSVLVKNAGMTPAKAVKVEAFADNKSLRSQTLDIPANQQAVASRFEKFPATLGKHAVKVVVTFDGRPQEATRVFEVKKGVLLMRPLISIPTTASLAFTGNDIQLNPVPQPGKPTALSVNVRNPGGVAATNAQFEAFVDGQSLGKVTKTIGALQTMTITGFPNWTSPAGSHTVKIVASIGRRQIAAEKALNVINTVPLKTIVRPAMTITRPVFGTLRPGIRPGGITPGGTAPGGTAPGGTVPGGIRPLIPRPGASLVDVGVGVGDIKVSPPNPKGDQDVMIHVTVHNTGSQPATGAMLGITCEVDRTAPKKLNIPISVPAGGEKSQGWRVRLANGSKLKVTATVSHKDDRNAQNGSASMTVDLGAAVPGGIRPPGGLIPGGIRPPIARPGAPDVAVTAADISYSPSSVKENDTLNFVIKVRNIGQGNAPQTKLTLTLRKDGAVHETKEFNLSVNGGQTANQAYSVRVPKARQLQLQAVVSAPSDTNDANGQATATVNVIQALIPIRPPIGTVPGGIQPGILPGRTVLAPDAMLGAGSVVSASRTAKVGQSLKFTIKVKNVGKGLAKGATLSIRFMVDGKPAGGQNMTLDVPAGATVERSAGLVVPKGRQVQCLAEVTVGGDTNSGNNKGSAAVLILGLP